MDLKVEEGGQTITSLREAWKTDIERYNVAGSEDRGRSLRMWEVSTS